MSFTAGFVASLSRAGVAELADALDSKAGAILGEQLPIDVLLTFFQDARPASPHRASIAFDPQMRQRSAGVIGESCTLYDSRRFVLE